MSEYTVWSERIQSIHIPSSSSLHHELAIPLSERICEVPLVALHENVVEERLATELVYPLGNLVSCGVP